MFATMQDADFVTLEEVIMSGWQDVGHRWALLGKRAMNKD